MQVISRHTVRQVQGEHLKAIDVLCLGYKLSRLSLQLRLVQLGDLLFSLLKLFSQRSNTAWQIIGRNLEVLRDGIDKRCFLRVVTESVHTRVSLDTTCTRAHRRLTQDRYWANLRRVADVRTTAELNGKWSTNFNHAHIVTVVFTKECHRTHCLGFFQRSLNGVDGKVR